MRFSPVLYHTTELKYIYVLAQSTNAHGQWARHSTDKSLDKRKII